MSSSLNVIMMLRGGGFEVCDAHNHKVLQAMQSSVTLRGLVSQ